MQAEQDEQLLRVARRRARAVLDAAAGREDHGFWTAGLSQRGEELTSLPGVSPTPAPTAAVSPRGGESTPATTGSRGALLSGSWVQAQR